MRKKILLVENDPRLRRTWRKFLEWEQYEVDTQNDLSSASSNIGDQILQYDILILSVDASAHTLSLIENLADRAPQALLLLVEENCHGISPLPYPRIVKPFYPEHLVVGVKRLIRSQNRPVPIWLTA